MIEFDWCGSQDPTCALSTAHIITQIYECNQVKWLPKTLFPHDPQSFVVMVVEKMKFDILSKSRSSPSHDIGLTNAMYKEHHMTKPLSHCSLE